MRNLIGVHPPPGGDLPPGGYPGDQAMPGFWRNAIFSIVNVLCFIAIGGLERHGTALAGCYFGSLFMTLGIELAGRSLLHLAFRRA